MRRLIILLGAFLIWSCNSYKKQFIEYHSIKTFPGLFEFAFQHQESIYLDSAILAFNDSLSRDKNFYLRIYDDSLKLIKLSNANYELDKRNIVLYNLNKKNLLYVDSIYTNESSIDSMFCTFIGGTKWGGVYIYSDTLITKENWISLFSMIDRIIGFYRVEKEKDAVVLFNKSYIKLDRSKRNIVDENIPIRIAVYFKNPFPPPPATNQFNYVAPTINDTIQ